MGVVDEEVLALPELALADGVQPLVFQVTDLKQWLYCRRIVYFRFNWPHVRPRTYGLEEGRLAHEEERARQRRRPRRVYGVPTGERLFDVSHYSTALGLSGRVDLVILAENEVVVVDFKDSANLKARHFRLQVVAYGLLMEERFEKPVRRGFLYSIPRRKAVEVKVTRRAREEVLGVVRAMAQAVQGEAMPAGPGSLAPCVSCEFRRFCNDRV